MKRLWIAGVAALAIIVAALVPGACLAAGASYPAVQSGGFQSIANCLLGSATPHLARWEASKFAGTADLTISLRAIPLGLAIADFTGDSHPDLAAVGFDRVDASNGYYVIEIALSEGGRQSLTFAAPPGGLLLTPKDVTGNGTLDLVVRSAVSRLPVAVFFNDGCGHFSPRSSAVTVKIQNLFSGSELTDKQNIHIVAVAFAGKKAPIHEDLSSDPTESQQRSTPKAIIVKRSSFGSRRPPNRAPPIAF
jgi:hypothetical protein